MQTMKLDNHNFDSSQQNEDFPKAAKEQFEKDSVKDVEKTLDSSQTVVEDNDGFWQVPEFDNHNSVNSNLITEEGNAAEVKVDEAVDSRSCETFDDISKNELEVPELVVCYRESSFLDVRDICVDENMPSCETVLFETDVGKEDLRTLFLLEKEWSNGLEDRHEVAEDVSVGHVVLKDQESAAELFEHGPSSEDTSNEDTQMHLKEPSVESVSSLIGPSNTPEDEDDDEATANVSHAEESNTGNPTDHDHAVHMSGSSNGKDRTDSSENVNQVENRNISRGHDSRVGSYFDKLDQGEMSFSMAGPGPVSGLITYSGPIAYSGSLSLRSESSTASTRSFAFPILQSEWHSSPVRMAKAGRRRFRWRHGLLCCRF